jgi:hypothetical protein
MNLEYGGGLGVGIGGAVGSLRRIMYRSLDIIFGNYIS